MRDKNWKRVVKEVETGKSLEEATRNIPLAVKMKSRRFKTLQISNRQQQAIRRG